MRRERAKDRATRARYNLDRLADFEGVGVRRVATAVGEGSMAERLVF